MKIDILTLFPDMFRGPFDESIIKRAREKGLAEISIHNIRDWSEDKHKTVDDRPFGGGVGMILKVDVLDKAINSLKLKDSDTKVVLLDAGGNKFTQKEAIRMSSVSHLILIAAHYEGVDYRVHEYLADEIISVGDYILTGGELPAMILTDAIVRLIPGVLEKSEATYLESFSQSNDLLEYPQYTRPEEYNGWKVPEVLLSGNHKEIEGWRSKMAISRTEKVRPDLRKG